MGEMLVCLPVCALQCKDEVDNIDTDSCDQQVNYMLLQRQFWKYHELFGYWSPSMPSK